MHAGWKRQLIPEFVAIILKQDRLSSTTVVEELTKLFSGTKTGALIQAETARAKPMS